MVGPWPVCSKRECSALIWDPKVNSLRVEMNYICTDTSPTARESKEIVAVNLRLGFHRSYLRARFEHMWFIGKCSGCCIMQPVFPLQEWHTHSTTPMSVGCSWLSGESLFRTYTQLKRSSSWQNAAHHSVLCKADLCQLKKKTEKEMKDFLDSTSRKGMIFTLIFYTTRNKTSGCLRKGLCEG